MFIICGLLGASVVSVVWMLKFWVLGSYVRLACPVGAFARVAVPFGPVTGVGVGPDGVGDGVPGPVVGATVGVPGPGVGAGVRVGTVGPPMMIAVQPLTPRAIAQANATRARNRRLMVSPPRASFHQALQR
jgi:hypothetical protein